MSISVLLVSPLAKGLFARAIMESGSAYMAMVASSKYVKTSKAIAVLTGQKVGCNQSISADFLKCLQNVPIDVFFEQSNKAAKEKHAAYGVTVENYLGTVPEYPQVLFARGAFHKEVDTIRGFNSQETAIQDPGNDGVTDKEFLQLAKQTVGQNRALDKDKLVQMVVDAYTTNVTDPFEIRAQAIQLRTDMVFILPTIREAETTSDRNQGGKSFVYQFNYRSSFSKDSSWRGIPHTAEISFVFGIPWIHGVVTDPNVSEMMSDEDHKVSNMVMDTWSNFAKYGNPTPPGKTQPPLINWQPFTTSKPSVLLIDGQLQATSYDTRKDLAMLEVFKAKERVQMAGLGGDPNVIG